MAYQILLGGMLFPVAPEKIDVKIQSNNTTISLIDGAQMNILKTPKLSDISFSVELPGQPGRSYAVYENSFQPPGYFLQKLEQMALAKQPVLFQVVRVLPDGFSLHNTAVRVSIEDYTITDNAKEGFDTILKLSLKQYTQKNTYTASLKAALDGSTAVSVQRQRTIPPSTPVLQTSMITAMAGQTLWTIAKKYLGDGSKYKDLAAMNGISNSGVKPGQTIKVR